MKKNNSNNNSIIKLYLLNNKIKSNYKKLYLIMINKLKNKLKNINNYYKIKIQNLKIHYNNNKK